MTPQDATEVVPYLTSAATIVYIQKWLHSLDLYQRFVRAFPGADKYGHWFVAGALSLVTAAGIHYVWTGSLQTGGMLTIHVPSLMDMLHGTADWFKVYILQATIYDAHFKAVAPVVVVSPPDPVVP